MNISKKIFAAALSAALAVNASSCTLYTEESHTAIELPQQISFSWWGSEIRSSYTLSAISEYEKQNPGIDVKTFSSDFGGYKENLDALMVFGKNADVMQINYSWLEEYSPDGEGFYDLNELSEYIALDNFSKEELSYGTIGGKLNAVPISLNAVTFYYNRSLFGQYDLTIPETWDDLFACAEVFSADGIYTLETADIYLWLMLAAHEEQISGTAIFGEDGGFGVENYRSMMEFAKRLADEKVINYGEAYDKENFFSGKSASQLLWVSDAEFYVQPLEDNGGRIAIGEYLAYPECERFGWYVKPTSLYAVSRTADDPVAAARLMDYLLNNETTAKLQGTEKGVPLSRSALETLDANKMLGGTAFEASQKISESDRLELMPTELETTQRYKDFFEEFDQYLYGQKTAEQAAADYAEKWS